MHSKYVTETDFALSLKTCCFYSQNNDNSQQKSILGDS